MIPVTPMPEPGSFDGKVRQPGRIFLVQTPNPNYKEWKGKDYWTRALDDLRIAYNGICAYSATWIPHSTGSQSVDHFSSKDLFPHLAYEWSNFRYSSGRFNGRKGNRIILDPFLIQAGWFQINFNTMFIRPDPNLGPQLQDQIIDAIDKLHLNRDDKLVEERIVYMQYLKGGQIDFKFLRQNAPFIAFELERQGLYTT